jgi:polyvinyl alcohol dehydrogenase (cytochrome)
MNAVLERSTTAAAVIAMQAAALWGQATAPRPLPADQLAQRRTEGAGGRLFGDKCASCHGNSQVANAPDPATLKRMTPEHIYQVLSTGDMKEMAKDLTDSDKRDIAIFVGGRRMIDTEKADAKSMPNVCSANPPIRDVNSRPAWNGWGAHLSNTRFQRAREADLSPGQVSRLKLKWAFGVPGATSMYGQPTIVDGRVFFGSDAGYVYSLDVETGCVHWSFQAQAGVRTAITIGPLKFSPAKFAAYFGDIHGNTYAVDASNGELLWKVSIDPHPLSRITGAPALYGGRLYVPVASLEEVESGSPNYVCCTFRGMVAALDAQTGKQLWKTYTIPQTPKVIRKNSIGKDVLGPSGAGVWAAPAIDPKRHALYIETGNAFSEPATDMSDAVVALDMDTGKILWSVQATPKDVWHGGCGRGLGLGRHAVGRGPAPQIPYPVENCPENGGPDQDFSGGAILVTLSNGKDTLVAGQKPGIVWGLDPDRKGAVLWRQDINRTNANSGIIFGGAADDQNAYFNLRSGDLVAEDLNTGLEKWHVPLPPPEQMKAHPGQTAAVTVIPNVVFSAGLDGMVRAFTAFDGRLLWEYNTAQEFQTINGITAAGGSIGSAGVTVAQGMVFVGSGYTGFQSGVPGNVLLCFAPSPIVPPYY